MVLGGEAFGRYLGREGGGFMNGISVLTKETPQRPYALLPCEDAERSWLSVTHMTMLAS